MKHLLIGWMLLSASVFAEVYNTPFKFETAPEVESTLQIVDGFVVLADKKIRLPDVVPAPLDVTKVATFCTYGNTICDYLTPNLAFKVVKQYGFWTLADVMPTYQLTGKQVDNVVIIDDKVTSYENHTWVVKYVMGDSAFFLYTAHDVTAAIISW